MENLPGAQAGVRPPRTAQWSRPLRSRRL